MGDTPAQKELKALCKLFIGGIPRSISDEQLAEAFLQFTDDDSLNDCVVIKDEGKNSRGFGFVTFNKLADTDNCLANRPHMLGGKEVEVKHAIPRDEQLDVNHTRTNKIFVGGLSMDVKDGNVVKEAIEGYVLGVGESLNVRVDKVDILLDKNTEKPRGFCFVEMASEDDADKVVIVKHFNIAGKRVELKKAEPKGSKGGGGGGRGGRGGRDSGRGGGRTASIGGGWGGAQMSLYDQFNGGGGDYAGAGFGYRGGAFGSGFGQMDQYYGGGYDSYGQAQSSFGPARSNNRYGGRGATRGFGRPGPY